MINFEEYNDDLQGKRKLYTTIPWLDSNAGFNLYDGEREIINIFKYQKLMNKSLKLTLDKGYYFLIPSVAINYNGEKNIVYYTGMSDTNKKSSGLSVNNDRPNELWIDVTPHEIEFGEKGNLYRSYYINVVNESDTSVQKYFVYVTLKYKNNGKIGNQDYDFDLGVSCMKIGPTINVAYGVIDFAFYGYILWIICNLIFNESATIFLKKIISESSIYIITLSYISQIIFRKKYIHNTKIDSVIFFLKKLIYKKIKKVEIHKPFLTNKDVISIIKEQYILGAKKQKHK